MVEIDPDIQVWRCQDCDKWLQSSQDPRIRFTRDYRPCFDALDGIIRDEKKCPWKGYVACPK